MSLALAPQASNSCAPRFWPPGAAELRAGKDQGTQDEASPCLDPQVDQEARKPETFLVQLRKNCGGVQRKKNYVAASQSPGILCSGEEQVGGLQDRQPILEKSEWRPANPLEN